MRIGVFDSGIGGVNVLSCLIKKYPQNEYIYFGDTINLPYGDKTKDELMVLACNAIDFLISQKVEVIIVACGTISSNCLNELKAKYTIPLYDILSPTIEYLKNCDLEKIGVIATTKTIGSKIFNINSHITTLATPTFVPIIENNLISEKKEEIIQKLQMFENYDLLVLGCTHYPVLRKLIEKKIKVQTLDMGEVLSNKINLSNNSKASYKLFFSLISVNLIENINNILKTDYEIYSK